MTSLFGALNLIPHFSLDGMVGRWVFSFKLIPGYRPLGKLANADLLSLNPPWLQRPFEPTDATRRVSAPLKAQTVSLVS
jgi:hypothetical protein